MVHVCIVHVLMTGVFIVSNMYRYFQHFVWNEMGLFEINTYLLVYVQ